MVLSIQGAPPLIPALISGRYHIQWTRLADLPAPLCDAYVAIQDKKVYVTAGNSPVSTALHQVYVYDVSADHWDHLPPSGHYSGIPCIIGRKLAIIGGCQSTTNKATNKVSTFDETSQTWTSYYPNLISARIKPGIVTHLEHVIVIGGSASIGAEVLYNDIEVLDWIENFSWKPVSVKLPVPMWAFVPMIYDDCLFIVGHDIALMLGSNAAYKISLASITSKQQQPNKTRSRWTKITPTTYWDTAVFSISSPPVVVGGHNKDCTIPIADIKMYDQSTQQWNVIASLSSARSQVAVAPIASNAVVAIGGCTQGGMLASALSSSLAIVELGQAVHNVEL